MNVTILKIYQQNFWLKLKFFWNYNLVGLILYRFAAESVDLEPGETCISLWWFRLLGNPYRLSEGRLFFVFPTDEQKMKNDNFQITDTDQRIAPIVWCDTYLKTGISYIYIPCILYWS